MPDPSDSNHDAQRSTHQHEHDGSWVQQEDQASGLRRVASAQPVQVIAVTSGKGGVGKTTVSANLGVACAMSGRRVMLLDADLGLANLDVHLGLHPRYTLSNVLEGQCSLEDVLVEGPWGMTLVPAASGNKRMALLDARESAGLIHAFSELTRPVDVLIIDTAAGLSENVASFAQAARDVVVTVCDDPGSITDAYALIKVLSRDYRVDHARVLTNMTAGAEHGNQLYTKIARVCERFLDVSVTHFGNIPHDPYLRKSVQQQINVLDAYPSSRAAHAFRHLAQQVSHWRPAAGSRGHTEFFAERLLRVPATAVAEAV
ncbi:MAG: MinD/ParA family protein [Pseudomonadota bacterium]